MSEEEQRERSAIGSLLLVLLDRWRGDSGVLRFGVDMPDDVATALALADWSALHLGVQRYVLARARRMRGNEDLDRDFSDFCQWLGDMLWGDAGDLQILRKEAAALIGGAERERIAARAAMLKLDRVGENLRKRQYMNALSWLNEVEKSTLEAFDAVLKIGAPDLEPKDG